MSSEPHRASPSPEGERDLLTDLSVSSRVEDSSLVASIRVKRINMRSLSFRFDSALRVIMACNVLCFGCSAKPPPLNSATQANSLPEFDPNPVTHADQEFLNKILSAVRNRDFAWIASHSILPLVIDGKEQVSSEAEFISVLKSKFTDDVYVQIIEDAKKPLFKNSIGLMVGNGILWFGEFGSGDPTRWEYKILAFGGFAFQPEDSMKITAE